MSKEKLLWANKPEQRDYAAAALYLSLIAPARRIERLMRSLRKSEIRKYSAKDLLRASGLPLLPRSEQSVKNDLKKISKGKPLAPVLLVCGDLSRGVPLTVADGYHRICAVCHYDEFAPIACQLAPPQPDS
jgi:hypothetical protein